MNKLEKIILPAAAFLALSGQAFSEETSVRLSLLEDKNVSALYTIDDFTTLVKAGAAKDIDAALEGICSANKSALKSDANSLKCEGIFTASHIDAADGEEAAVIISSETAQPLAYRNQFIPSIDELAQLPGGRIEGEYTSIDIYQYMYALCKKGNGTPSVVLSKRFGKTARYTEVSAQEAFDYLLESGDGKDPWFFACEGDKRFIVEKDYQHNQNGANRFSFHPKRGLEWVDYVKADDGKVASLEAR